MEMEYFVPPAGRRVVLVLVPGALPLVPRPRHAGGAAPAAPHDADELSHYSSGTSDVEFLFPWGWDELEGIANRATSTSHSTPRTPVKLDYFDQAATGATPRT
jgi:glycyl-tRNA synthetase